MLYPRESETREIKDLSGIWEFRADAGGDGTRRNWQSRPLRGARPMPVPASYNDLTQDTALRDHVGDVWYERAFFAPASWRGRRVDLRVGSASHHATAWINGVEVASHKGGFLPFEGNASAAVRYGAENRLTIRVNNVLDWTCLPPGEIVRRDDAMHPPGFASQEYFHDFFNYAGIHRPVRLVVTPVQRVEDVTVVTDIRGGDGVVRYRVFAPGVKRVAVTVLDEQRRAVAHGEGRSGTLIVRRARLWAPLDAYLYTLRVECRDAAGRPIDVYGEPFGIRTVSVRGDRFLINGKPFHFRGMCKHEDADMRGKGMDHVVNVKDVTLFRWMGANSFRTSHYPYAEEMMELCDREGIVVIDELPAVGFNRWNRQCAVFCKEHAGDATLEHHRRCAAELVARDKNHPCVVMWSVANEPATYEPASLPYFRRVFRDVRRLDPTRPLTLVECTPWNETKVAGLCDVLCVNRYFSWYSDSGRLDVITHQALTDLRNWHKRFRKPIIVSEFGADTLAGLHASPPEMFSEEYQVEFLRRFCEAFDRLPFVIGEHVWNFADFATKQEVKRVIGNRKGVFTRQRQPKAAAHYLRERWLGRAGRG